MRSRSTARTLIMSRPGVLAAADRRGVDLWESPQMEVSHRQIKLARYGLIDVDVYGYADGRYVAKPSSRHPLPVIQAPLPDEPQARSAEAAVEWLRRALDRA
jgi:hypothetical protein